MHDRKQLVFRAPSFQRTAWYRTSSYTPKGPCQTWTVLRAYLLSLSPGRATLGSLVGINGRPHLYCVLAPAIDLHLVDSRALTLDRHYWLWMRYVFLCISDSWRLHSPLVAYPRGWHWRPSLVHNRVESLFAPCHELCLSRTSNVPRTHLSLDFSHRNRTSWYTYQGPVKYLLQCHSPGTGSP